MRALLLFLVLGTASAQNYPQNWNHPHYYDTTYSDFSNGAFTTPVKANQLGLVFTIPTTVGSELSPVKSSSAVIKNAVGKVIRTLWQNRAYRAGQHGEIWDGLDDYGVVAIGGPFTALLEYNGVDYKWDGVLGDTNPTLSAPNSWDGTIFSFPVDMVSIGLKGFTAAGYDEGNYTSQVFKLATPNLDVNPFVQQTYTQNLFFRAATDGNLVYFAQDNPGGQNGPGGIVAFDPNGYLHNFSKGVILGSDRYTIAVDPNNPRRLTVQVADYMVSTDTDAITGIAVQRNGPLMASSHGKYNNTASPDSVHIFNKLTGQFVQAFPIQNPQRMAFDLTGNLWVISGNGLSGDVLYKVTNVGSTNNVLTPITGLSNPVAVSVSPLSGDLFIADGGTNQRVMEYSVGTNTLLNTLGTFGGYGTGNSCNSSVSPYKFWFDYSGLDIMTQVDVYGDQHTPFINVDDNGDLEVDDPSTGQIEFYHLDAGIWTYTKRIMYQAGWRSFSALLNDPTRIFIGQGGMLEISRDWTKPLLQGDPDPAQGGNGSWALKNNWAPCIMTAVGYQGAPAMQYIIDTWKSPTNNNTYMLTGNQSGRTAWSILNPNGSVTMEVMPTNSNLFGYTRMSPNGDQVAPTTNGIVPNTVNLPIYHLTGYDSMNMPTYGPATALATVAVNHANGEPQGQITSDLTADGALVMFEQNKNSSVAGTPPVFHLGAAHAGSTSYDWKAYPEKDFAWADGNGYFPKANLSNIASEGGEIHVSDNEIFTMFAGNYAPWGCQFMHYHSDGMFIGQFGYLTQFSGTKNGLNGYGVDGISNSVTGEYKVPGFCGDVGVFKALRVGNNIKILHPDESYYHGLHEWDISGLDTITEVTGTGILGSTVILQLVVQTPF